jgi:hypothetical protein
MGGIASGIPYEQSDDRQEQGIRTLARESKPARKKQSRGTQDDSWVSLEKNMKAKQTMERCYVQ